MSANNTVTINEIIIKHDASNTNEAYLRPDMSAIDLSSTNVKDTIQFIRRFEQINTKSKYNVVSLFGKQVTVKELNETIKPEDPDFDKQSDKKVQKRQVKYITLESISKAFDIKIEDMKPYFKNCKVKAKQMIVPVEYATMLIIYSKQDVFVPIITKFALLSSITNNPCHDLETLFRFDGQIMQNVAKSITENKGEKVEDSYKTIIIKVPKSNEYKLEFHLLSPSKPSYEKALAAVKHIPGNSKHPEQNIETHTVYTINVPVATTQVTFFEYVSQHGYDKVFDLTGPEKSTIKSIKIKAGVEINESLIKKITKLVSTDEFKQFIESKKPVKKSKVVKVEAESEPESIKPKLEVKPTTSKKSSSESKPKKSNKLVETVKKVAKKISSSSSEDNKLKDESSSSEGY
jgi:hypothetical protein